MKIAHISDFHLRHHLPGTSASPRRQSRKVPDLLEEAVARIRAEDPDLVAITGDLVDHPFFGRDDPDRLKQGEKDLRLIQEIFQPLTCPVVFVYGNHDHPDLFRRVFSGRESEIAVGGYRVVSFFDEEVECHFPQRMGAERERFLSVLEDGDPRPQIHLQHYLIAPELNEGYPHTYREWESLKQALLEDGRIRMSLSGHYHPGKPLFCEGGVHFGIAPAFCEPPHSYYLYEIGEEEIVQQTVSLRPPGCLGARRPAVFLDRDGTINPQPAYRTGPEAFRLIDGVGEALALLKERGFALVVVTNQTAVGMGFVTVDVVSAVNDEMAALLAPFGVELDGVYCCYQAKDAVLPQWRTDQPGTKPNPTMLQRAAEDLHLDLSRSFVVGDSRSDLEAGRRAGCRGTVLVLTGNGKSQVERLRSGEADCVAADLAEAVRWILEQK